METTDLSGFQELRGRWVAIDPDQGIGRRAVIDFDDELDDLCTRLVGGGQRHLTIFFCGGQRDGAVRPVAQA